MPHHTALIGDIRGSRSLDNWPAVFAELKKALNAANRRFAGDLLIKFHATVGDEFQGALQTPEKAFDVYTFIKASLLVPLYAGLGIGEVEKSGPGASGLRGTAFYRAREALETCKQEKGLLRVRTAAAENRRDRTMNVILQLLETLEMNWTNRQREIINFYRLHPQLTHLELGNQFSITQPAITQVLRAASFSTLYAAEQEIKQQLSNA